MKRERRNFTEEFKREAVKLVGQPGATRAGIARDLALVQTCLAGGVVTLLAPVSRALLALRRCRWTNTNACVVSWPR